MTVEKGRQYLKEKNYPLAVREFKSAAEKSPENSETHYFLALSYVLMGKRTNAEEWFLLAESPVRNALKIDSSQEKYHDLLVEIKSLAGKLDELSREYRRKIDEESGHIYARMLEKIATIGVLSIPATEERPAKVRHKGYIFIHYFFIPATAAVGAALWILGIHTPIRNLALMILALYVVLRIFSGIRFEKDRRW